MIMCTSKHYVFFLEKDNRTVTLRCNKIFLQLHLRQSSFAYISQEIFYTFDKSLSFYLITMAHGTKDFLWFFSLTQLHCNLKSLFCLLYSFSAVKLVSELNLWQVQNKSSNICSCSSLKRSKALQKLVKHNNLLWFHCTCFSIHQGPAVWLI